MTSASGGSTTQVMKVATWATWSPPPCLNKQSSAPPQHPQHSGEFAFAQTLICGVLLRYYFFFSVPFEYKVTVWAGPVKERRQLKHGIGKAKDVILGTSQISPFCNVPILASFASVTYVWFNTSHYGIFCLSIVLGRYVYI